MPRRFLWSAPRPHFPVATLGGTKILRIVFLFLREGYAARIQSIKLFSKLLLLATTRSMVAGAPWQAGVMLGPMLTDHTLYCANWLKYPLLTSASVAASIRARRRPVLPSVCTSWSQVWSQ